MFRLSLILLCLVVAVTLEYEFKCPYSGEWRFRAVGFNCSFNSQYVCIFKYPERTYHETCDGLDYSNIGSKLIYEPFFNKAYCSYERYQPFPFSTDGNSNCVYQKSFCTEKGQYLFRRGSQRSDITCGCDLTKGYEFVTKPNHDCYCVPSEEDCSCHKLPCNNLVDQCPQDRDEMLTRSLFPTYKENGFKDAINIFDDENNGKTYRFQCLYISSVLLAAMIIVVILFFTFVDLERRQELTSTTEEVIVQKSLKNNLPVSANLRQKLKISKKHFWNKDPYIYRCIKTGNTFVFTDNYNDQLFICNADGTDKHHMSLSYSPYYITEIDSNTVAVSCIFNKTILIINISTRSITSKINTSGECQGISYNDNNLYVVIDMSITDVMDLTGKVIRTIPAPSGPIYDITVHRDRLVCLDYTTSSIYCCSLDGKLKWKFKMNEFHDLTCVTTDDEGNVYVTDWRTNTVTVISDDGKHHRELLTKSDGLNEPTGIYLNKKENILLVCNFEGKSNAVLFDMKYKLS